MIIVFFSKAQVSICRAPYLKDHVIFGIGSKIVRYKNTKYQRGLLRVITLALITLTD